MDQSERRLFLIRALLSESRWRGEVIIPSDETGQRRLLRSLMNVRMPAPISDEFIRVQDEYLREVNAAKGVTRLSDLSPVGDGLYLWQGDITTLECDAIVNAANSHMLGCFQPLHSCIDNCIHTYAGVQLRLRCSDLMDAQGHEEPTGQAKITPAYNLPSKYVIHTVGPIVSGRLNERHCEQLRSCYFSCLKLARENGCKSIAFCCISTGVFGFPQREAARLAVETVKEYKEEAYSDIKVIFNVFRDDDLEIYRRLLGTAK